MLAFRVVFVLLGKESTSKGGEVPEPMKKLLKDFDDTFSEEFMGELQQLRDIKHQIDFVSGSNLPNREHEELRRQVEELFAKGYIWESFSPCAVPPLLTCKKDGS